MRPFLGTCAARAAGNVLLRSMHKLDAITRIIEAATHADEMNLARLALGFPAIATAVSMFKNNPDGTAVLRRLASKTPDIQPDDGFSPKGN